MPQRRKPAKPPPSPKPAPKQSTKPPSPKTSPKQSRTAGMPLGVQSVGRLRADIRQNTIASERLSEQLRQTRIAMLPPPTPAREAGVNTSRRNAPRATGGPPPLPPRNYSRERERLNAAERDAAERRRSKK